MKMAWVFLTTLLLFHLVLVPSLAAPPRSWYNFIGFGGREGNQLPEPLPNIPQQPKPIVEQPPEENQGGGEQPAKINGNLKEGFYSLRCPNAEKIVADALAEIVKTNPNAIPNLIRLQFHDCFVGGCDASILLDYVPTGEQVEKSSMSNGLLLKGSDLIDDIKAKLEQACPQTVSCADTLAFATNEAMIMAGIPRQRPLGGRRDGVVSLASMAEDNNLPLPNWPVDQMIEVFRKKGFNQEEMVILLGAHSVGSAHCDFFLDRIYDFRKTQQPDPRLPPAVVDEFKQICTNPGTYKFRNPPVNFDETPTILDNLFFKNLVERNKSLLLTDSHLIDDPRTAPTVQKMAADPDLFPNRFAELMKRLSSVSVLTGKEGEVRKTCRSTN